MKGSGSVDRIAWQPLSEQAIVDALAQNKRVFVDVTADWCVTCKANKYNVLLQGEVQRPCPPRTWWPCAATGAGRAMPSPSSCASVRRRRPLQPDLRARPAPEGESLSPAGQGRLARRWLNKAGLIQPGPHF